MKKNVGTIDRLIRAIIAIILTTIYLFGATSDLLGIVLIAAATILMVTSLFGTCPLYSIFGLSTCDLAKED